MTYAADAKPPFYHGTRADFGEGDLLTPGVVGNFQEQSLSWIYFSATLEAAIWGAELARYPRRPGFAGTTPTALG